MSYPVAIVLANPENPDNVGAVARAMKNTGFSDLRLVTPPRTWKKKARKMAMSARDILDRAVVFSSLAKATQDRQMVIGTTRRQGPKRGLLVPFGRIPKLVSKKTSAIVFGRESKGLSNAD